MHPLEAFQQERRSCRASLARHQERRRRRAQRALSRGGAAGAAKRPRTLPAPSTPAWPETHAAAAKRQQQQQEGGALQQDPGGVNRQCAAVEAEFDASAAGLALERDALAWLSDVSGETDSLLAAPRPSLPLAPRQALPCWQVAAAPSPLQLPPGAALAAMPDQLEQLLNAEELSWLRPSVASPLLSQQRPSIASPDPAALRPLPAAPPLDFLPDAAWLPGDRLPEACPPRWQPTAAAAQLPPASPVQSPPGYQLFPPAMPPAAAQRPTQPVAQPPPPPAQPLVGMGEVLHGFLDFAATSSPFQTPLAGPAPRLAPVPPLPPPWVAAQAAQVVEVALGLAPSVPTLQPPGVGTCTEPDPPSPSHHQQQQQAAAGSSRTIPVVLLQRRPLRLPPPQEAAHAAEAAAGLHSPGDGGWWGSSGGSSLSRAASHILPTSHPSLVSGNRMPPSIQPLRHRAPAALAGPRPPGPAATTLKRRLGADAPAPKQRMHCYRPCLPRPSLCFDCLLRLLCVSRRPASSAAAWKLTWTRCCWRGGGPFLPLRAPPCCPRHRPLLRPPCPPGGA
jgi:hypothetical protein